MRVLFLTTVLPSRRRGGGEVVSEGIVSALRAAGHEVVVTGYARPDGSPADGEICVGRRPIETSTAGARSGAWVARALLARVPYSSAKFSSRSYRALTRELLEDPADLIVIDHPQVHFLLDDADPRARLVFVAHNAEALLYQDLAATSTGVLKRRAYTREARLLAEIETGLARRVGQVWTLTEADAAYFRRLAPGTDVRLLPVAPSFSTPQAPAAPAYDVALLGTWTWKANRAGLDWFVDEVLPLLEDGLTVAVAGAGSERLSDRHPALTAHGVVPDPRAFLSRARVIAIPSVAGGGTQVKTLDAIAAGVGVVATPLAVRGLDDLPAAVVLADHASAFAAELRRLAAGVDRQQAIEAASEWAEARQAGLNSAIGEFAGELEVSVAPADAGLSISAHGSETRPG